MAGFDAELYLRLLGERAFADLDPHGGGHRESQLDQAAAALVFGQVIDDAAATAICDAYAFAREWRRQPDHARHLASLRRRAQPGDAAPELTRRRVFIPAATIQVAAGELQVDAVTVSDEGITIDGLLRCETSFADRPGRPPPLTVGGATPLICRFSGRYGNHGADGRWDASGQVALDGDEIEIDGHRLALGESRPAPDFGVEDLPADGRLRRYLWQRLATPDRHIGPDDPAVSIAAMAAAGLIDRHDPVIAAIAWARRAIDGGSAPSAEVPPGVPPPWKALLTGERPAAKTSRRAIGIGAVSPRFDGIMVAVDTITVAEHGLAVEVEVSGAGRGHRFADGGALSVRPISWWAADDRGNQSVGRFLRWSSSGLHMRGALEFASPDPRARELTLTVATPSVRASLVVDLERR